ncbi:MAG TPA: 23S rRNA (adenine(2503)-C(2))-methyltransferase RlmN [Acidimicrobiales bacterium]|nr:23S rRNA (adenine(2503)-C(2))-methyltransferase RlmN [Acidimicrobiales bacterium]
MSRYELSRADLAALLADQPRYRADQVWEGLYRRLCPPAELSNLPAGLRRRLAADPALAPALELAKETTSTGTVKWLWRLADGASIETVLMTYRQRVTACVSSQAGCAMGCGFCATGQAGFTRHLAVGEMVEQVARAAHRAAVDGRRLSNVVFMGMGEPLANYDRVWAAIERIHDEIGLSARHVTVSTVGLVPGIRRLSEARLPVNLAVSLHAANDELRDRLVPINRRYPLAGLVAACHRYFERTRRRISFEWALIDGVNDRPVDAGELAAIARPLAAHVNLIPLNPTPGWPTRGTDPAGVARFQALLAARGVNATVRANRGTDIDAACGQLAARSGTLDP